MEACTSGRGAPKTCNPHHWDAPKYLPNEAFQKRNVQPAHVDSIPPSRAGLPRRSFTTALAERRGDEQKEEEEGQAGRGGDGCLRSDLACCRAVS